MKPFAREVPVAPVSRTRTRIVAAALGRLLLLASVLIAAENVALNAREDGFHFRNYLSLKSGERFRIIARNGYAAGSAIGEGRVLNLSARKLELEFRVKTLATGEIRGLLRLAHLGSRDRYKERFRLRYSGDGPNGPEKSSEIVIADSFLIRNGILSLYFSDRNRFFQLSLDSSGRNSFITHWGASHLQALR